MELQRLNVAPGPAPRSVRTEAGQVLPVPADWELLAPGDAALTRRVKQDGPSWVVTERRGRKLFSRGVWAPAATIERHRAQLALERADPRYARKLEADRDRRGRREEQYGQDFRAAIVAFLAFAPGHAGLGLRLADAIAEHATPVGSGTVARTQRIPIEQRAQAATIAWLRHQTTAYDSMHIPRIKGMRREVRRLLAQRARELLDRYRRTGPVDPAQCPLQRALGEQAPGPGRDSSLSAT